MPDNDLALTAHLMRRAAFGATREELEELSARSYESLVDDLLNPERFPPVEDDVLDRYYGEITIHNNPGTWLYRMVNTRRPLEEKMVLFLHHVFATAYSKDSAPFSHLVQLDLFRRIALTDWRTILVEVSKDPLMISWLDNSENHKDEPNENYGREVLELFSMGIGSYTEDDVKECARAFTGWTFTQPIPLYPCGHFVPEFEFVAEDHDEGPKSFLGHSGNFNGEDVIDIIARQPATAEFVTRHLYSFFVADEAQVPAWSVEPPRDPEAIEALSQEFMDTGGSLRPVLRLLFNSDFFKEARYARVKSPAELVAGTIKLAGTHRFPDPWPGAARRGPGVHGPAPDESAHRRGMAHGAGVDRRRRAHRAGQLRRRRAGRRDQAGRQGDDRTAQRRRLGHLAGGAHRPEPRPGRAGRGQRRHPEQPAGPLPLGRGPDLRDGDGPGPERGADRPRAAARGVDA